MTMNTSLFARKLLTLSGTLYAVASLAPPEYLDPLNRVTARMVGALPGFFAGPLAVSGPFVTVGNFTVRIIPECTPLFVLILYVSFVLAYPASWKQRGWGLLLGIPSLVLGNLLRLAFLLFLGIRFPGLFEPGHVYLGQFIMILLVCLVSVSWVRWIHEPYETHGLLAFFMRFLAFSPLLLLAWLCLNRGYVLLEDRLIRFVFSLFGYRMVMPRTHGLYYHTFNVAVFCGLMFSLRSFWGARGIKALAGGLLLLSLLHLLVRLGNVLATGFGIPPALGIGNALHLFGLYALPLLLWFRFIERGPSGPGPLPTRI
jgi:exosortase H (IPTLxxWG-CTERM-specific)